MNSRPLLIFLGLIVLPTLAGAVPPTMNHETEVSDATCAYQFLRKTLQPSRVDLEVSGRDKAYLISTPDVQVKLTFVDPVLSKMASVQSGEIQLIIENATTAGAELIATFANPKADPVVDPDAPPIGKRLAEVGAQLKQECPPKPEPSPTP